MESDNLDNRKYLSHFVPISSHFCIQLSACDVTSGNVLGTWVLGQQKGWKGKVGGFQHWAQVTWVLLGLAVARAHVLSVEKSLVSTG